MKNKLRTDRPTLRNFGAILATAATATPALSVPQTAQESAAGNATQPQNRPAPGNFRRPMAPDTPAFEEELTITRKDIEFRAEPFPMKQVRLLPGTSISSSNCRTASAGRLFRQQRHAPQH